MQARPYLAYEGTTSTGSYTVDFGGLYQNLVVAVHHPSTKQVVYTVDQGVASIWSTGLVSATSSTGDSITLTTSTKAFDKARVVVSANGSTAATSLIYLGAF